MTTTAAAYEARAEEYIDRLGSMASVHPSDRQIIDSWAQRMTGRVLDAGCGPGHWTKHLSELGLDVRGIDLVPAFIAHARSAYPGIPFDVRSVDAVDEADGSLTGLLSWFSTIHYEPSAIAAPIAEFARVLRPGGQLVLGFFTGDVIEPFDHAVLRAFRWPTWRLQRILAEHDLSVIETHVRETRGQRPVGTIICERRGS